MLSTELCLPYRPPLKTDVGSVLFLVRIARIYAKQFLPCNPELKRFGIPSSALETTAGWFRPDSFLIATLSLLFARNYKICHRPSPCYNGTPEWEIIILYLRGICYKLNWMYFINGCTRLYFLYVTTQEKKSSHVKGMLVYFITLFLSRHESNELAKRFEQVILFFLVNISTETLNLKRFIGSRSLPNILSFYSLLVWFMKAHEGSRTRGGRPSRVGRGRRAHKKDGWRARPRFHLWPVFLIGKLLNLERHLHSPLETFLSLLRISSRDSPYPS